MALKYVQTNTNYLAGSGVVIGATSIILTSFNDIYGNALAMTDFGAKGYGTLEPDTTNEEAFSFTGLVVNASGTVTLSGVSTILAKSPYTETSGLVRSHSGGTKVVITDNAGFWNSFANKQNDETISGKFTFPNANRPTMDTDADTTTATDLVTFGQLSRQAIAGASNASTTVKGLVQEATQAQTDARTTSGSTGAELYINPGTVRSTLLSDYKADTGTANTYAIAPSPAITAYAAGQIFSFKAVNANTTASTLNVNALGAKTIKKNGGQFDLVAGDIAAGDVCLVEYDGTNFQLLSSLGKPKISQDGAEIYGASSGGTDTYAITLAPAPAAYTVGQVFRFKADVANTGAASLNVNSLGALTILRPNGNGLVTGDIVANQIVEVVVYDGSNVKMISPLAGSPAGLFTNGTTTKDASAASTSQTIAHGLGVTPKQVTIQAMLATTNAASIMSYAVYNGTTQSAISSYFAGTSPTSDATFTLNANNTSGTNTQVGVITFDSTNITITWTKTGSPSGTYQLLWTAQA